MYSKKLFIFLNIIFFAFAYIGITFIPNPLIMGIPLQLLAYFLLAPLASLMWGLYFIPFFNKQKHR